MFVRRASRAFIAGVLIAASFFLAPPPTASAAWCSGTTYQDFDDDDRADLVVARTMPTGTHGVVDIRMSSGTTQTISADDLGYTSAANDQFGASVDISNIDELDNCPDLLIGAPGSAGGGAVYLVRGNGNGIDATTAIRLPAPIADARFGTTVSATDLSLTRVKLLVGAPGLDVGSATDAGGVMVWQLSQGEPTGSPATFTYADFGATPATGDHLGAVMDVVSWTVTLGVPDRNIGAAINAGEVVTFSFVDEPNVLQVADWTRANQNSPGAPGVAEAYDRFGASVDAAGAIFLVGVPGEDVGERKDVGAVAHFVELGNHTTGNWVSWTQDSSGVPGANEAGDRFGAAVHLAWIEVLLDGDPYPLQVFVVGAPGEDIGSVRDAGAITVLAPGVKPAFGLSQGSGLPGKAERGDQVGAAFGDLPGEYRGPYYGGDGIVVGAPGEDVGTTVDTGLVMYARGILPKGKFSWGTAANLGTHIAGARYGWTLPTMS
ncbi:MAG: hypothetical protein IPL41_16745 [Micropruina sp.]|nr:hypothetical protein [Micropruina sp.]